MPNWPVTVAFTDAEAEALSERAEVDFDGDRDAAVRAMLNAWLEEHGGRSNQFRR